ncbi:MAG: hypothetical protein IIY75_06595 [Erysipelotrichales bacterium]|nr:hypothetical protein [Erysipelotrichales bacterium]
MIIEILGELILDLILEGSAEGAMNPKNPKPLRIFLGGIVLLFFAGVIGLVVFMGISVMESSPAGGIVVAGMGLFLAVLGIIRIVKTLHERKNCG